MPPVGCGHGARAGGAGVERRDLEVRTHTRTEVIEITEAVREAVRQAGLQRGLVHCFLPHTTAGLALNERNDTRVVADIASHLDRLVPWAGPWTHQNNAAAHVKASLLGQTQVLAVEDGALVLGDWQGLFVFEFHGPRSRTVRLTFQPG